MDLPRMEALNKHWLKSPPVHISMAAYVGWGKSQGSAQSSSADEGDFEMMMASTPVKGANNG
jgi:hypothetical protein